MPTAGRGVVTESGKRGVGSNGKGVVFDASGECAECCEVAPCEVCRPTSEGGTGADPNDCEVTIDAACMDPADKTFPFSGWNDTIATPDGRYCSWFFSKNVAGTFGQAVAIYVYEGSFDLERFLSQGGTVAGTISAGQWAAQLSVETQIGGNLHDGEWIEVTSGFECDPVAQAISGTHTFAVGSQSDRADGDCVGLTPTITVPA